VAVLQARCLTRFESASWFEILIANTALYGRIGNLTLNLTYISLTCDNIFEQHKLHNNHSGKGENGKWGGEWWGWVHYKSWKTRFRKIRLCVLKKIPKTTLHGYRWPLLVRAPFPSTKNNPGSVVPTFFVALAGMTLFLTFTQSAILNCDFQRAQFKVRWQPTLTQIQRQQRPPHVISDIISFRDCRVTRRPRQLAMDPNDVWKHVKYSIFASILLCQVTQFVRQPFPPKNLEKNRPPA